MRIAVVMSTFPALSETFILNQITGLIDRGHEVDIYAERSPSTSKVHSDVEKYNLLSHTYYFDRPDSYLPRLAKGVGLCFTNFFKAPIVTLRSLNVFKHGKAAASLTLLYAATPFLKRKPVYDIVHCHFGPNGLQALLLKDIGGLQGKLVTTFHGFDVSRYVRNFGTQVYDRLFEEGDLFMTISERMKQQLIDLGCNEQKIKVHRVGIDVEKFAFIPRRLQDDQPVQIVSIARLVEKKGLEYGIRAVAKLAQTKPNLKYFIVGDGLLRKKLEDLIYELDVSNIVELLGWKQQQEVLEILEQAHLLLAPSVTGIDDDQEGIPVVLMEAMAGGIPIISTYHSGIPELVENGISGFLVPEKDVDTLTEKLSYLIDQSAIWSDMGQAGRMYVEKNFEINQLNDQLVETYQSIVRSNSITQYSFDSQALSQNRSRNF